MSGTTGERPGPADPRATLARLGIAPKRHFSQNFLLDRNLAARIAELVAPAGAFAIEIGAGTGALTRPLLERCRKVLAIERDRDLVPALAEELAASVAEGKLEIAEADAKAFDYAAVLAREPPPRVVVGNLPYHLSGVLLEALVGVAGNLERAGALVQLEVATRLASAPGSSDYGALSVFTQAAFRVTRPLVVRRGAFYPQPGVDSALVVLEPHAEPLARETPRFRALVKAAFSKRRKQLKNAWAGVLTEPELLRSARGAGIDLARRGETLSVVEFARMAAESEQ
ncbi:MAG TPA: 16S rRNA (adenine(1518)-N(6)/adenine(1519)-N(6))-dimethyltransferase RsmA [Polyangiaceae bacterium]|jgi:16S rRNA (adenine1518-N6/adenine1519-N6)-dimethyltransferase|nr:16S rRNA (adenine(1518)-N(6)/adenine(1519)-N(6))-dimethyltransferase RsmA [Polyangiaceae bacterium]